MIENGDESDDVSNSLYRNLCFRRTKETPLPLEDDRDEFNPEWIAKLITR
jgi:hypothetical protein